MRYLFAIIIFFLLSATYAQTKFGFKTGISLGKMTSFDNQKFHYFLSNGITKDFKLSTNFYIQTDLLYTLKGNRFDIYGITLYDASGNVINSGHTTHWTMIHFIELPILLKLRTHNFFLNTGTSLAFNVYSENRNKLNVPGYDRFYDFTKTKSRPFDLPIISSLGFTIPIKDDYFLFELRQSIGTFNIIDNHKTLLWTIYSGYCF